MLSFVAGIPVVRKNKNVQESEATFSFSYCMREDNDGLLSWHGTEWKDSIQAEHYRNIKNFTMLSSTCLYIAYSFCSALHRVQVWKTVFRRYCDSGLKWCWSTLTENNERFSLTSSSFSLGLQGRGLRHETSLMHPNALTQIALADSSDIESRICTSESHLIQACFAACKYTEGNRYAR